MATKGERTRQHFIETSAQLFNQQGYAGTSISEILDAAGYSKGALYRTFSHKEELTLEAFKHNFDKIAQALWQHVGKYETATEKILAMNEFYTYATTHELFPGGCPALNTAIEADDTNPDLNRLVAEAFTFYKQKVVQVLRAGKASGEFSKAIQEGMIANFIIANLEGCIMLMKTHKDVKIMQENGKVLEIFLGSLR